MNFTHLFSGNVNFHNKALYGLITLLGSIVVVIALGPGLTGTGDGWQYHAFHMLCHQLPDRSFFYNDHQMAVCARCFGIYGLFLVSWLFMPLFALFNNKKKQWYVRILIFTILINVLDVVGNYFHVWTNTLTSRFILGALISVAIILLLSSDFFKTNHGKGSWKIQK